MQIPCSALPRRDSARSCLVAYRELGEDLWERFNGGRDGTLWYFGALVYAFGAVAPDSKLLADFRRAVAELTAAPSS